MDALIQDLRSALRGVRRYPGITLAVVLTLGLGIGGNATVFSLLRAAILRAPDYPQPDRLVMANVTVSEPGQGTDTVGWSYPKFETMRSATRLVAPVALFGTQVMTLTGTDEPERVRFETVSPAYFTVLGLAALRGRVFDAASDSAGQAPVIVLSHALWLRRFGGDRAALGRTVQVNGTSATIIGVMPAGVRGLTGIADAWVPLPAVPALSGDGRLLQRRWAHRWEAVGRLAPAATFAQARAESEAVGRAVDAAHPLASSTGTQWGATLTPFLEARVSPEGRAALDILAFGAVLVLLVACVNIANMLLARAESREREFAIRAALGAGRLRLGRQLVAEALMLGLLGGGVGILLASWGVDALATTFPADFSSGSRGLAFLEASAIRLDPAVLGFTLLISAAAGALLGSVTVLRLARGRLLAGLRVGGLAATGFGRLRRLSLRGVLVVAQVALALVLLAGAGLVGRSLSRLMHTATGFTMDGVLTLRYRLTPADVAGPQAFPAYHDGMLERLASLPGVEAAAIAAAAPLTGEFDRTRVRAVSGRAPFPAGELPPIQVHSVSPDYFRALDIPLRRGRLPGTWDGAGPLPVAISEAAARALFDERDPIGQTMSIDIGLGPEHGEAWIVGVVGDVRHIALGSAPQPDVYVPHQAYPIDAAVVFLRTRGDPLASVAMVRRAVRDLHPDLPLYDVRTLAQRAAESTLRPRVIAAALGAFGVLALLLAGVGVYGVLSYTVARRTQEVGVRMALGARAADVIGLVVRQGMLTASIGVAVGLALAAASGRILRSVLYQVSPGDPLTLGAMALLLLGVALAAACIPALRAARVDPMVALRSE